jgi:hypothetical protein
MANLSNPNMSKRNLIWLALIIAAAVIGGMLVGMPFGLIPAAVVLVISEIVERSARRKRRQSALTTVDA